MCCPIALWDCFWEHYLFCYWLLHIGAVNWVKIRPQNSPTVPFDATTTQSPHQMASEPVIGILRSAATSSKQPVFQFNYLNMTFLLQIQENVKTLTQDRDNIQLLYEQATDEIQRLRRQVSRARSPSPSRAASAVLVRVESERDAALADVRRSNIQLDNLEDKLKVCCRENPIPSVRLSRTFFTNVGTPPYDPLNCFQQPPDVNPRKCPFL